MLNTFDFDSMVASMDARFEAQVAEMQARHAASVAEMRAEADARFEAMRLEREATDAVFQERLSALEEKELAANVDRFITNICMLVNTTRRFS